MSLRGKLASCVHNCATLCMFGRIALSSPDADQPQWCSQGTKLGNKPLARKIGAPKLCRRPVGEGFSPWVKDSRIRYHIARWSVRPKSARLLNVSRS